MPKLKLRQKFPYFRSWSCCVPSKTFCFSQRSFGSQLLSVFWILTASRKKEKNKIRCLMISLWWCNMFSDRLQCMLIMYLSVILLVNSIMSVHCYLYLIKLCTYSRRNIEKIVNCLYWDLFHCFLVATVLLLRPFGYVVIDNIANLAILCARRNLQHGIFFGWTHIEWSIAFG